MHFGVCGGSSVSFLGCATGCRGRVHVLEQDLCWMLKGVVIIAAMTQDAANRVWNVWKLQEKKWSWPISGLRL